MQVSIFASAVRTQLWQSFYESIKGTNQVDFEIIFAGPAVPDFPLPDGMRHIKTDVKPGQCFEIAARAATGEVLLQAVDDVVYSPGAIDMMYEAYSRESDVMITAHYAIDAVDYTAYQNLLGQPSDDFPLLPVCGMFSRELYHGLGGADRRFSAMQWELDMYMRMCFHGIRTVFVDAVCSEVTAVQQATPTGLRLGNTYWEGDRALILRLWTVNGVIGKVRIDGVQAYSDENILTVSQ